MTLTDQIYAEVTDKILKELEKLAVAIDEAGILLSVNIAGAGTAAIEQAIAAVGRLVSGTDDVVLSTTHH